MRAEKELLLDEITEQIKLNKSFLILSYSRLTANVANAVRRAVAKKGGSVEMTRKRILIKAADKAGIALDLAMLSGHIGLVFAGEDPIETTKVVFKFGQENGQAVQVLGARFEGQLYNAADVEQLSKLPGKNEMRAQLLGVLQAPMADTLAVIEAILSSVVYCIDNKCKKDSPETNSLTE